MEQAFGADFRGVRVHADIGADALSQSLQARAFTTGQDIFFKSGEYNPESSSGKQLLAHELTHTRQQGATDRLARWGGLGTSHAAVTKAAIGKLPEKVRKVYDHKGAKEYIADHSAAPDRLGPLRGRLKTGITAFKKQIKTVRKLFSLFEGKKAGRAAAHKAWVHLIGSPYENADKDHMLNHATGGMYKIGATESSVMQDTLKRVLGWVKVAVKHAKKNLWNEAYVFLGFALHVAEDIGAHGNGVPGTGHDPRRVVSPPDPKGEMARIYDPDWDWSWCDHKSRNTEGYKDSIRYAQMVLTEFANRLGRRRTKARLVKHRGKYRPGYRYGWEVKELTKWGRPTWKPGVKPEDVNKEFRHKWREEWRRQWLRKRNRGRRKR
jgi:hypothetical protein